MTLGGMTPVLVASEAQVSRQKARYCRLSISGASRKQPGGVTVPAIISKGSSKKYRSWGRTLARARIRALPVARPARPIRWR